MQKCSHCQGLYTLTADEIFFYQRISVPPPTWCWRCRAQRRMAWRNERTLYKNKCAKTGKDIITIFSPDSGLVVWDRDVWWQDNWSAQDYGADYNWSQPFFQQWAELYRRVPHPAVFNNNCTNSAYCNHVGQLKDCYLVFASWDGENLAYCAQEWTCRDSFDLLGVGNSELTIESINSDKLYNCAFAQNSENCHDSMFIYECRGCSFCFGCTNLRGQSYYIFNQPYSEADYFAKLRELKVDTQSGKQAAYDQWQQLKLQAIHRYASIFNSENCSGDNMSYAHNCQYCFGIKANTTDCKYCMNAGELTDAYDGYGVGANASLLYEMLDSGVNGSRQKFGGIVWGCTDVQYCYNCHNSKDLFGCVGLRGAQYCILNKQYTKAEYDQLVPKIITHMNNQPFSGERGRLYKYGEFFPMEISPFAYNETVAQEYFTRTQEQVLADVLKWRNPEDALSSTAVPTAPVVPIEIAAAQDDLTNTVFSCTHHGQCNEQCTLRYKILPTELALYRKMNLALPTTCPNCRHYARLGQRHPLNLWQRQCMCQQTDHKHSTPCPVTFDTTYAPERSETIYCESCYQQSVY